MNKLTQEFNIPAFIENAFYNDKKYTCIAAGRRTGKTYNAVNWLCEELLCNSGKAGLWVDTTQRNLTEYVEIYFKKILAAIWHLIKYDKQGHKLEFPNGSFLHLRSAERPENMEGFEYDYVVCNEAGIIFKRSELWTNTLMPMCKNAVVKIVGTPKGMNYYADLANNAARHEDWATYTFTAYDSPYWTQGQLEAIKTDPSVPPDVWEQEYEAKFITTTSNVIVKRNHKASWRDDKDIPYTINHAWVKQQLSGQGFYFVAFDGGMHTTHSAAILGYHNRQYRRDILLKEFYNINKNENLREIAQQVQEFGVEHDFNIGDFKLFGDPAIATYGDEIYIKQVLDLDVNLLDGYKNSDNAQFKTLYTNRKTRRLTILNTELFSLRSDNQPAVILLKEATKDSFSFGCPNAFNGMFGGQYRYEIKDIKGRSIVTDDIEQIPPITDICDAYTYYLLATRPFPQKEADNKKYRTVHNSW